MNPAADSNLIEQAVATAGRMQARAAALQTRSERRRQAELDRMVRGPADKALLVALIDQAFRSDSAVRVTDQFTYLLRRHGLPRFFSPLERALLAVFRACGAWLPGIAVPQVKAYVRRKTTDLVLPAENGPLAAHLRRRHGQGVRVNLNLLGEAILGEDEAAARLERYLETLQLPDVEVLSVKISTLYSQVSPLARRHTLDVLGQRLERLYREALHLRFRRGDGRQVPKFIYLDMEEYRDLDLTAEAFMRTLSRPGLEQAAAGIALQAYIPDSAQVQRTINAWARRRVAAGGAPVTIRIVKGANREMERVEASLHDWPQAPFRSKPQTDANYKRMLHEALRPENLAAVHVGVASHNVFDLAYGLVLAAAAEAGPRVQFEMLEGMANHQVRALAEQTSNVLLYAPACRDEEFLYAIGYLIRRLDENTSPENFLRHAFQLVPGGEAWQRLEGDFRASFAAAVCDTPRRTQDRRVDPGPEPRVEMPWQEFRNEPDTDFALPHNAEWAEQLVAAAVAPAAASAPHVEATPEDLARSVICAQDDPDGWRAMTVDQRNAVLGRVAQELRRARGALIRAAMVHGGKTVAEADPEVSEAIDFVEFYRSAARYFYELPGVRARGKGVVVVVSPWNFPIAIPCGGMAAALAAGNTAILKPASDTVPVAWELCQCYWRAGVPRTALQFTPCPGAVAGAHLLQHETIDAVILTGGTETARRMLRARPALPLFAETGGKNAIIVTAMADRELAVKHVVHSAFSHSGQKCSACSLLLLEAEVYDDPHFQALLCDAVRSLPVGPAYELETRVGPLIRPPSGELEQGLMTLEPGESWAVTPRPVEGLRQLWSPGVKYGVRPGSMTHCTELFGPVLGVMRFATLDEAIGLVNATGYGLTSGIETLDEREIERWRQGIRAGNLYVNKPVTGAVVLRQPFGGYGKSCFGPGMKAGGPNYVAQFLNFDDLPAAAAAEASLADPHLEAMRRAVTTRGVALPEAPRLLAALASYDRWAREEFLREHDHFRLLGEDNIRRYLPFAALRVRVCPDDTFFEIAARAAAARVLGSRVVISYAEPRPPTVELLQQVVREWGGQIEFRRESDQELAQAIAAGQVERVRYARPSRVPDALRLSAAEHAVHLADSPVLAEGRVELLWYVREQSVSYAYHRYGNLGLRAAERRREPA